MGNRVVREAILVVSNGGTEMFERVFEESGCSLVRVNSKGATRAVKKFIGDFGQGIPIAVVHGQCPDDASALAEQLKSLCGGIRVIVLSEKVIQPARDSDKAYDVIIPHNCGYLQDAMRMFLGVGE